MLDRFIFTSTRSTQVSDPQFLKIRVFPTQDAIFVISLGKNVLREKLVTLSKN